MNVVVTGVMQDELGFGDKQVWSLEEGKYLELVLVDGLHELLWPEPDVIVLVHQQEVLLRDLLFDR